MLLLDYLLNKYHSFLYKCAHACSKYKPTHLMNAFYEVCLQIGYHDGEHFVSFFFVKKNPKN